MIRDYVERILIMVEPSNSNSIKKELKIEIASEKRWEHKWASKRGAMVGAGLKTHHK